MRGCTVSQLAVEQEQLDILIKQIEKATESTSGVAIMGNLNMDDLRKMDGGYYPRALLSKFLAATKRVGLKYIASLWTWQSHGKFSNDSVAVARRSCLNHTYVARVFESVHVLDNATTDHRTLVLDIKSAAVGGMSNAASK
jgi:hypothetical protein